MEKLVMHVQPNIEKDEMQLADVGQASRLSAYPIDMSPLLTLWQFTLDDAGVPFQMHPAGYHPTNIAQYALSQWNQYLATNDERHRQNFLTQAHWLVEHEICISNGAGGWPISSSHLGVRGESPWLSALTQGQALSVLARAYQLTQEEVFLEVARRAVRTFQRDILDGGVITPIGEEGIFFEEVAVYPAIHILSGFIFALFGLYDYVALTDDGLIKQCIEHGLKTMHDLLEEFDADFWVRTDLLHRQLATPDQLDLQITLLESLTIYSGCEHCLTLTSRWRNYRCRLRSRLRYLITSRFISLGSVVLNRLRSMLFPKARVSPILRVCVPITAFPVTGGMRTVLSKVAQATSDIWHMEYLTPHIGPNSEKFVIHQLGPARVSASQFPMIWLYCVTGFIKLISLIRQGADYNVILPQDGIFTAAFAALAGKLAGIRIVCVDHGNLGLFRSHLYRIERQRALATLPWTRRLRERIQFVWYWPSLYVLAWFAAHLVDQYVVPGAPGDGVEDVCKSLGVGKSRLTRFTNVIDLNRHIVSDPGLRAKIREKNNMPADAIVISMICRLAPEKGLEIALEGISQALSALPPDQRALVRVIFAGDGPLRKQLESDIRMRSLSQTCKLCGEASEEAVISLLDLSDIFLFTSWRAAGYPLAILEAMASCCAVVATDEPLANVRMLTEGRGILVAVGDAEQTGKALVRLINDPALRHQMGTLAREYIAVKHNPALFRRVWMRATYWSELNSLLHIDEGNEE
jgi:glycosyltransferase involved in cell wall biosynthesis